MIKNIKVTRPNGEIVIMELTSPEKSGFSIEHVDGLGPSKSTINMSESLFLDGALFNSARVQSRNIVLDLKFHPDTIDSIETLRHKSYRSFPMKTPLLFEVETDNRTGVITAYVESNEPDIFSNFEGTKISLLCPNAYFAAKEPVDTTFSGFTPAFEFPFENTSLTVKTLEMGVVFINTSASVFNTGDISTGVIITLTLTGAVTNIFIVNSTTSENMAINSAKLTALIGSNFQAGDVVTISTIKGDKYIVLERAGVVYNILNAVDILSDWFRLEKGDNLFSYVAAVGTSNIQMSIQHTIMYEGM